MLVFAYLDAVSFSFFDFRFHFFENFKLLIGLINGRFLRNYISFSQFLTISTFTFLRNYVSNFTLKNTFSSNNAKLYIIKNSSMWKKQVVMELVFLQFSSIWKKHVHIKLFIHVHFKWVEKYCCFTRYQSKKNPPTIFLIFQYHIRRTQQNHHLSKLVTGLSQHTTQYPTWWLSTIHENDFRRYEKNITHDDYQLSTKTTRDHEDDGIMEQNRRRFWGREFIRRQCVLYFIFNRWCVITNVSFRIYSGVLCFWGGFIYYSLFLEVLGSI